MDKLKGQASHTAFEPNAILRGAQLTLVGAQRALQNPALFTSEHYRQAALAVLAGIAIRILVAIPTLAIRLFVKALALLTDLSASTWDEEVIDGLEFIEHSVLQLPFFLMSLMRYLTPTLDNMFMDSLAWVDQTYTQKHRGQDPRELRAMYYPNLKQYPVRGSTVPAARTGPGREGRKKSAGDAMLAFLLRFGHKAGLSLGVYLLSFLPYVGRFVLPAATFYTFNKAVGPAPAVAVFATGIVVPKRYLVMFLQSYFSSRSLMRELLEPYFARLHYTPQQKKFWFRDREGVLYGFALAFFAFLKIPLLGVLIYGIAEASTAYLITKITEPPPPPQYAEQFKEKDVRWENKHEFLGLPLEMMDKINVRTSREKAGPVGNVDRETKERAFT